MIIFRTVFMVWSCVIKMISPEKKNNNYDILILGDCYPATGIEPDIIQEKTGLTGFNFSGAADTTILFGYVVFSNYLKSSPPPKYLIISYLPQTIYYHEKYIQHYLLPYFYHYRQGNLMPLFKEFGFKQGLLYAIPSLGYQSLLKKGIFMDQFWVKDRNQNIIDENFGHDGYVTAFEEGTYTEDIQGKVSKINFPESSFYKKYFIKILDLAQKNDVTVYYIIPTVPKDYYAIYKNSGLVEHIHQHLQSWKEKYPNLTVLDPQSIINEKSFYADRLHMNRSGSRQLSHFLADTLL